MSISQSPAWAEELLEYHGRRPASLVSGGMESICPLIPQNVIVRVDSNSTVIPKETYIHHRMILKTILSGKLNTKLDGLNFPMSAGDSVLFFPLQFHSSIDAENMPKHSFIAVSFNLPENDFLPLLPLKNRILKLSETDLKTLKEIAGAFYGENGISHSEAVLKLAGILLHQLESVSGADDIEPSGTAGEFHRRICNFIRANFDKKLSLKSLAAEFGCSTENIRKTFLRHCPGITPGRLISRLQIQQAVELLENTDSPIGQIAVKCGFTDTFTFSKRFKKVTGVSPREYRRALAAAQINT